MSENWEMPDMVRIPAVSFTMGDTWNDGLPDEQPTYEVQIESFQLGKHAVTNRQYIMFLNDIGAKTDDHGHLLVSMKENRSPHSITFDSNGFNCPVEYENFPVTYVSWFGAVLFCEWLSRKSGKNFRLPTEEQWQYAAMGPNRLKWGLGNEFDHKSYICSSETPEQVDTGSPSDFGLYNMTGNVFEWCSNEYTFRYGSDKADNVLKNSRSIRGGAFLFSDSQNFRNSARFSCYENSCLNCIGFRIATD